MRKGARWSLPNHIVSVNMRQSVCAWSGETHKDRTLRRLVEFLVPGVRGKSQARPTNPTKSGLTRVGGCTIRGVATDGLSSRGDSYEGQERSVGRRSSKMDDGES